MRGSRGGSARGARRRRGSRPRRGRGLWGGGGACESRVLSQRAREGFVPAGAAPPRTHREHEHADALLELRAGDPVERGRVEEGDAARDERPEGEEHRADLGDALEGGRRRRRGGGGRARRGGERARARRCAGAARRDPGGAERRRAGQRRAQARGDGAGRACGRARARRRGRGSGRARGRSGEHRVARPSPTDGPRVCGGGAAPSAPSRSRRHASLGRRRRAAQHSLPARRARARAHWVSRFGARRSSAPLTPTRNAPPPTSPPPRTSSKPARPAAGRAADGGARLCRLLCGEIAGDSRRGILPRRRHALGARCPAGRGSGARYRPHAASAQRARPGRRFGPVRLSRREGLGVARVRLERSPVGNRADGVAGRRRRARRRGGRARRRLARAARRG